MDDGLPGDLGLHGGREQRGGEPDEEDGADDGPGPLGERQPGEPGDPQRAAREDDGTDAVPVGERAAHHEQPLLAEGPQSEHEPDQPARHADVLSEVLGEEGQDGEEAEVEGELGEEEQADERGEADPCGCGGHEPARTRRLGSRTPPAAVTASAPSRARRAAGARTAQGARSA